MTAEQIAGLRTWCNSSSYDPPSADAIEAALDEREALVTTLKRALLFVGESGLATLLAEAPVALRLFPTRSGTAEWLMAEEEKAVAAATAAVKKAET